MQQEEGARDGAFFCGGNISDEFFSAEFLEGLHQKAACCAFV
jgi:hypothetical protein